MNKIPVTILGATGIVGQRFIQMLADHPWFEIAGLAGSERSSGSHYGDAVNWVINGDPPAKICDMPVLSLDAELPGRLVFSALPSKIAMHYEPLLAEKGYVVCSNASAYRLAPDVPMIIPEVNHDHLSIMEQQKKNRGWKGLLVTSPNCTTTGMVMPLKPLHDHWQVNRISVVSFQAISGAGYPGVPFLDALDNLIPYIPGEEEKLGTETRALLGSVDQGRRMDAEIIVSAQANRAPVLHGHTVCLSVGFKHKPSPEQSIEVLENFHPPAIVKSLPSAPAHPLLICQDEFRPQPRRDRDSEKGMSVTIGRVRECPLLDIRLVSVVHNAIRGAAGGSILNAELLVEMGYLQ